MRRTKGMIDHAQSELLGLSNLREARPRTFEHSKERSAILKPVGGTMPVDHKRQGSEVRAIGKHERRTQVEHHRNTRQPRKTERAVCGRPTER